MNNRVDIFWCNNCLCNTLVVQKQSFFFLLSLCVIYNFWYEEKCNWICSYNNSSHYYYSNFVKKLSSLPVIIVCWSLKSYWPRNTSKKLLRNATSSIRTSLMRLIRYTFVQVSKALRYAGLQFFFKVKIIRKMPKKKRRIHKLPPFLAVRTWVWSC